MCMLFLTDKVAKNITSRKRRDCKWLISKKSGLKSAMRWVGLSLKTQESAADWQATMYRWCYGQIFHFCLFERARIVWMQIIKINFVRKQTSKVSLQNMLGNFYGSPFTPLKKKHEGIIVTFYLTIHFFQFWEI